MVNTSNQVAYNLETKKIKSCDTIKQVNIISTRNMSYDAAK